MTKKISFGIVLILIILSIAVSSVTTAFVVFNSYNSLLVDLPQRAEQYLKLSEIDELVRSEYYGSVDSVSVDDSLASGYINGLADPNSFYISSEDIDSFYDMIQGKASGIGINAYFDFSVGALKVSYIVPSSPADNSGISTEHYITSVDGKEITEDNYKELLDIITNSRDKKIKLVVSIKDTEDVKEIEFNTGYNLSSCTYLTSDSIGYIRLSAFYEDTLLLFSQAIEYFKTENISAVILDLRNSTGTDFDAAAKIIDLIVPVGSEGSGAIYTAKNSAGDTVSQFSSDSTAINMSFAILVNSRTEGAAELVACDLRDFGKGIIIGEQTAGHGTLQKLFELDDGGMVCLTVAEVFPYISSSFNECGLTPDIEVLTSESFKNQLGSDNFTDDEQYKAALSYLSGK